MSADNWTTCPRCKAERDKRDQQATDAVAAMYGTVSVEEFERARAELRGKLKARLDETFREDYEFYGASDGTITADYGGSCQTCGLTARLKHSVTFWPTPEAGGGS